MVSERQLDLECDKLEDLLAGRGLMVRAAGADVLSSGVQYYLLPAMGTKISAIRGLREEMQAVLDVDSCRVEQQGRRVVVVVPRDDRETVEFWPLFNRVLEEGEIPHITALLGQMDNGQALLMCLSSPSVGHVLISGTTGSGKSVLSRAMALSLARLNASSWLRLVLIDPKGETFVPFHSLRHVQWGVITQPERALGALERLVAEMEARQGPGPFSPTIVVMIDELVDLAVVLGKPFLMAVSRLVARGRSAGIHVIAATQKPTSSVIGPLIKASFPVRICLAVTSEGDARVATGWSGTGAEKLAMGGAAVCVAEGELTRFQVAYIDDGDLATVISGMPVARSCNVPVPKPSVLGPGLHPHEQVQPLDAVAPLVREPEEVRLGRKLLEWEEWPGRWRSDRRLDYRWGFISEACRLLFEREAGGGFYRKTSDVLRCAEKLEEAECTRSE